jgi:site-specific DNA recombinase
MSKAPSRVVLYARFSPRPHSDQCDSVENQLDDLRRYCEAHSWPVDPALAFDDKALSGGEWARPGLWNAVQAVRRGTVLMCRNFDRLARDVTILGFVRHQVLSRGGRIVTLESGEVEANNPVAKFMSTIFGAIAEFQRELTAIRTKNGVQRNIRKGRYNGTHVPYGYRWVDRAAGLIEPVPAEMETLEVLKGLFDQGAGLTEIAATLNAANLPWKDGQPWNRYRVRNAVQRWRPPQTKKVTIPKL